MSKEFYYAMGKTRTWPEIGQLGVAPSSLTYDDVLLVPRENTEVSNREQVNLSVQFGDLTLTTPIMTAPMDTVTGEEMAIFMHNKGGISAIPRGKIEDRPKKHALCARFAEENIHAVWSIGIRDGFEEAKQLKDRGATIVLIDVAHGGMIEVKNLAGTIQDKLGLTVIAGNIATYNQAMWYKDVINMARVGVGPGGACTTRIKTKTGFPQLSAVLETTSAGIYVIADGGIKNAGDAAAAYAAGAKMIMIGSMLSGTDEAPGEMLTRDGKQYKMFRGQASKDYMDDHGVPTGAYRTAEGITTWVLSKGEAELVIDDITGGVRSACSYQGAFNLEQFEERAVFNYISGSTHVENGAHVNNH